MAPVTSVRGITVRPLMRVHYLGRVVKASNVNAPTPLWMKEKLHVAARYSLHRCGGRCQLCAARTGSKPVHAFDKDRIDGGIVVRMAKKGETVVLLDGSEATLNADTLVM